MPLRQKTYDHRLKTLVRQTKDITIATRAGVPRSTASGWLKTETPTVVTVDALSLSEQELQVEVVRLRRRVQRLRAAVRLLVILLRAFDVDLAKRRLPDGAAKASILRSIDRARQALSLRHILRILGLSASRYHAWNRAEKACTLDDSSSCPKASPHRLTADEVEAIRDMVTSTKYRHVPTGTLSLLAQRMGRVYASATTWHRLVRERGWRRPRLRLHPSKPRVGIRAEKPDEIWHVDTSIIRLVDGTKAYVYALIDNFSRRIISWRVGARFDPASTLAVLLEATQASSRGGEPPIVMADGGGENVNGNVDELINSGLLKRVLAMTEIRFSNSMIEAWWRALKHQWLFLHTLDSVERVRSLVEFYVTEHNQHLPHSAFRGQTPDEMYFGTGSGVTTDLDVAKSAARHARLEANRTRSCPACEPSDDSEAA